MNSIAVISTFPHLLGAGMTPDMPVTLAVAIFGSVMSLVLPPKYAIIPLVVSMVAYPSELLVPPPEIQMTAQRLIGLALFLRCIFQSNIRSQFKWTWADTGASFYYLLMVIAQILTSTNAMTAINNRVGFFLSALVPYSCARLLVNDRPRFYIVLKTLIWTAAPLAVLGVYQMMSAQDPYASIMQYSAHWAPISAMMLMQRPFLGTPVYRSTGPFMQCIMYGWFFAIWITPATNLFFEKKSLFPWIFPWLLLPVGMISTVSAGPMTMAAITFMIVCCFPFRHLWKIAVGGAALGYLVLVFGSNRTPMEIIANFGFDASSSWFRVGLIKYVMDQKAMMIGGNHWITGYGEIPAWWVWHDLCIHWVYLIVLYGLMGVIGFYGFVATTGKMLWKGKARAADSLEDQWLLWSMMAALLGSMLGMLLVSLFAEMFHLYHLFLGLVANAFLLVGTNSKGGAFRHIGVMAEIDGKPVVLRYRLRPGQKLAVMPAGAESRQKAEGSRQ